MRFPSVTFVALTLMAQALGAQDAAVVNPKQSHGARGDGKASSGCSMTVASKVLTCPAGSFAALDAGKVIAVYGAGRAGTHPTRGPWVQPLSSTIARYIDDSRVELAAAAITALASSERTVWGTDDTKALQSAVDAVAQRGGGTLDIPSGIYLTTGLTLPCGARGTFRFVGPCPRAYNNITIRGAGARETTLENWHVAPAAGTPDAVISIGRNAHDNAYNDGNTLVSNLDISDLALRQVKNPSDARFILIGRASTNVVLQRVYATGWSYEGIVTGGDSSKWQILDNEIDGCGRGGPLNQQGPACLNPTSSMSLVARNTIRNAGACFEAGGYQNVYEDNTCSGEAIFRATGVNSYCFFIGSQVTGIYDVTVRRNTCVHADIGASNVLGTINRIRITDNSFRDAVVSLLGGLDANSVPLKCCPDTVIHGESIISGNSFTFSREHRVQNFPIRVGGVETVVVKDNRVTWTSAFGQQGDDHGKPCAANADVPKANFGCRVNNAFLAVVDYGGGRTWQPSRAYQKDAHVIPAAGNEHFYVATTAGTTGSAPPVWPSKPGETVRDGGVTWKNDGPLPRLTVQGNSVTIPDGISGTGSEVSLFGTTNPATVIILDQVMPFAWTIQCANAGFEPRGCNGGNVGPINPKAPYTFKYP